MNNGVLKVLKERRSIRSFKPEQITDEELNAVLETGTYAANSNGSQAPVIIAIQNPKLVKQIDEMSGKIVDPTGAFHPYYGAPTIILVLAPEDGVAPVEDGSLAAGNMLNAAYAAGLGSCWIHRSKDIFSSEKGKVLLKQLSLPENLMGVASIALGYANGELPKTAPRKENYILHVK